MFSLMSFPFNNDQIQLLDKVHNKDFEAIWSIREDEVISIDVFVVYQINEMGKCIVTENGRYLISGSFSECIDYIHPWL